MHVFSEHYPEEYIRGWTEFFGKKYILTTDVLIPRLETECLVRRARHVLQNIPYDHVYDIGSGSGIIGTSLADLADSLHFVDISPSALKVSQKNFVMHFPEKSAQFHLSDLLLETPLSQKDSQDAVLLVANLPYIRDHDWEHMSKDTIFEPKIALFGGENTGFELYERLFEHIDRFRVHGILLMEFGFDQLDTAKRILASYTGWKVTFFSDYAGIERFAHIIIPSKKSCNISPFA